MFKLAPDSRTLWVLLVAVLCVACSTSSSSESRQSDPSFRFDLEQVRFSTRGYFPFDFLIGQLHLKSEKVLPINNTWYPDKDATAIRVFEDGIERPVLTIERFADLQTKLNLLVLVPVTRGLAVGAGGSSAFEPHLISSLQTLARGYSDNFYNLAVIFCWGATEKRFPFSSAETAKEFEQTFNGLTFPGPSEGDYFTCLEPALADLAWLDRATPESAKLATLQRGTLPLFFEGNQNARTQVLLLTDGVPFREGPLETFSDLVVQGNFSLTTLGIASSSEGERGLTRLRQLYERRHMGGNFSLLSGHDLLDDAVKRWIDSSLSEGTSFVVSYVSGFSGVRGQEVPVWAAWKNGQYTSSEIRVTPGEFQGTLRWTLRLFLISGALLLTAFFMYRWKIWPFREAVQIVPCPEGCGHLIPREWPVCRFCERKSAWGRLVLVNGDLAGKVIYLKDDFYQVGAGKNDDIIVTHLKEYKVSEAHASLQRLESGEKIVLTPKGKPVKVASRSVIEGGVNLRFGDIIQFGEGGIAALLLRGVESTI